MRALWQGDKRWGKAKLGEGGSTFGKAGCVVTCLAQAMRQMGVDNEATPLTVQAKAFAAGGEPFRGPNAITGVVAAANGMVCADRVSEVEGAAAMQLAIGEALVDGTALLHVDHDQDRGGTPEADHWVLAVRLDGDDVVYLDPATADEGRLQLRTLTGPSLWDGVPRVYRVRGVRALRRA